MSIDLLKMMRSARAHRERDKVPGVLHKGVVQCLKSGNNVGIPKEDYLFQPEAQILQQEEGGFFGDPHIVA